MTEPTSLGRVHIVGIGGAGMSGIARIMVAQGVTVSGIRRQGLPSAPGAARDRRRCPRRPRCRPRRRASTRSSSRRPSPRPTSSASAARERGIRELSRAEALAAVMAGSRGVAVAGTHGKTTTTSMLTVALQHCGVDPSFAIGSELNESGSNAHLGHRRRLRGRGGRERRGLPRTSSPSRRSSPTSRRTTWTTGAPTRRSSRRFLEFATGIRDRDGFIVVCVDDLGGARLAQRARRGGCRRAHLRRGGRGRLPAERCPAHRGRAGPSTPSTTASASGRSR